MRRYLIYAMVYGSIGVCVGLAMAYVSKDGQPYFSLVGNARKRDNMVELPQEKMNHEVVAVEIPESEEVEISE